MEQERRWIKSIRCFNILPNIVCLVILYILVASKNTSIYEQLFIFFLILSIITYLLSYWANLLNYKTSKNVCTWTLGLITGIIWQFLFALLSLKGITNVPLDFTILTAIDSLLSLIIISYPFFMLYYNYQLLMNELAKPTNNL